MFLPSGAISAWLFALGVLAANIGGEVRAQQLFKCGAGYQDKPCAAEDTQKRFSPTSGTFSIEQVNPDTDRDCALFAAEALPFWQRMKSGESFDSMKAQIDARAISRFDKSQMRDALSALRQYKGTPQEVRSQLETQCMNVKRMRGIPTEKDRQREARTLEANVGILDSMNRAAQDGADEQRLRMEEYRIAQEEQARARSAAAAAAAAAAQQSPTEQRQIRRRMINRGEVR